MTSLRIRNRRDVRDPNNSKNRGQATTEYALILLVAAVIASLVIAWATVGGGSGRIGELFDTIFEGVLQRTESGGE
ncbi:MAG: hypothetical protein RIR69_1443 [Actinomycetota bacterium]|jgi:hypothetical protein